MKANKNQTLIADRVVALDRVLHTQSEIVKSITGIGDTGLDWLVGTRPVFNAAGQQIPNAREIVREDTGLHLGMVRERYTPIQNSAIWDAMEHAMGSQKYTITAAGTLDNCRRVFIATELVDDPGFTIGRNDKFSNRLVFFSSHDSSVGFHVFDLSTRLFCTNQFRLNSSKHMARLLKGIGPARHTKNSQVRVNSISDALRGLTAVRQEFYKQLKALTGHGVKEDEARTFLTGLLWPHHRQGAGAAPSAQLLATVDRIVAAFLAGKGNKGETRYDLFNGITEEFTHLPAARDYHDRANSAMVGTASNWKGLAFDAMVDDWPATLERGRVALGVLAERRGTAK